MIYHFCFSFLNVSSISIFQTLQNAIKTKDKWGKAVAEATRLLFTEEELLSSVVTDPNRSTDKTKPRLDEKKVALIKGNVNSFNTTGPSLLKSHLCTSWLCFTDRVPLYFNRKGLKDKVPTRGAISDSISSVMAHEKKKAAKLVAENV